MMVLSADSYHGCASAMSYLVQHHESVAQLRSSSVWSSAENQSHRTKWWFLRVKEIVAIT